MLDISWPTAVMISTICCFGTILGLFAIAYLASRAKGGDSNGQS